MLRADHLAHQYSAGRPFAAETEAHQRAENKKLRVTLSETAQKSKDGKPNYGDLQRAHTAEAVRKSAGKPAAKCGGEQRCRSD
jgi:hypothetical protein